MSDAGKAAYESWVTAVYGTSDGPLSWASIAPATRDYWNNQCRRSEAPAPVPPAAGKATNPKDAIGSNKLPLHLWPTTATAVGSIGLLEGMLKYGRTNWREAGVKASVYVDACKRHIDAWFEGEENATVIDEDGNEVNAGPHLGNALACLAIIVDARAAGKLNDDRNYNGAGYRQLVNELTPIVARLKRTLRHHDPKHYMIADNQTESV